jgi:Mg-chelatase subunit ChlD
VFDQDDKRTPIDLICVIDKSGSMSGKKIKLVRETLEFIIDCLNENDRISVIAFNTTAERVIPLTRANKNNKQSLTEKVKKIDASGRTNINDGLNLAFKTLSERRNKNPVSSILLLSDGRDDNKEISIRVNESLDK